MSAMLKQKSYIHKLLINCMVLAITIPLLFLTPTHTQAPSQAPHVHTAPLASTEAPLTMVTPAAATLVSTQASAQTNPTTNIAANGASFEQAYGLPTYPHPEYQYHALISAPTGPPYTGEGFLSRISATTGWNEFNNTNAAP